MKRGMCIVLAATLMGSVGAAGMGSPAASAIGTNTSCNYIFLVPHQDDDTLSMGAAIQKHTQARGGNDVCAVLWTTGANSGVRARFGAGVALPKTTSKYVNPAMTQPAAFTASRDAEFVDAMGALGIPAGNIHLGVPGYGRLYDWNNVIDPATGKPAVRRSGFPTAAQLAQWVPQTQVEARKFVSAVLGRFGSAKHYKTQSYRDPSPDHRALGTALRERAGSVGSARFYFPKYQLSKGSIIPGGLPALAAEYASNPAKLQEAFRAYGYVNASLKRFGIGWISVAAPFGGDAMTTRTYNDNGTINTPVALTGVDKPLWGNWYSLYHQ